MPRRRHGRHNFWRHGPHDRRAWYQMFEQHLGQSPEDHWMFGGRRFKPWLVGETDFNPFVAMALSKGGGLLPLYVLHLLSEQPRYGNEVMNRITERTGGSWGNNPGAIYPLLTLLEHQDLIEGVWEDPTRRTVRRYHITPRGVEELDRLKAVMRPKLEEALDVLQVILDDLSQADQEEE